MDTEKEADCWSCKYSHFNSSSGELICSLAENERPSSCHITSIDNKKKVEIEAPHDKREFGMWR